MHPKTLTLFTALRRVLVAEGRRDLTLNHPTPLVSGHTLRARPDTTQVLLLTALTTLLLTLPAAAQVQPLTAWWTSTGETDSTWLGLSLANLGDVNGDGFDDFCAGGETNRIYVYYGNSFPDSTPAYSFGPPGDSTTNFSYRMFNIGDVNGDGGVDLLVQSRIPDPWLHYCCYLYFGGAAFDTIPDLVLDGESPDLESGFGYDAGAVGDFNGDGGNDFIIGDGFYEIQPYPHLISGKFYLYFGGNLLDSIPDLTMTGSAQFDRFYGDIAEMGDINDDGFSDFLLGDASCTVPNGYSCGAVILFSGGSPPNLVPDWYQYGDTAMAKLGMSVAGIDFNHDGIKDLIVGNREVNLPNHFSAIYIYYGGVQISNTPDKIFVDQNGIGIGWDLFGCDLNGDGYEDIISCVSGFTSGDVFVWLGGQDADSLIDANFHRSGYEAGLGTSHISCDVNGDGIDDMVIGEPGYYLSTLEHRKGRVHVILGDTTLHQSVGVPPIKPPVLIPSQLSLTAYPNPFNANISLKIEWQGSEIPNLEIYNLKGELIKKLTIKRGQEMIEWNGVNRQGQVSVSGIYLAKLYTHNQSTYTKIALVK
ncbi:MAG: FG-GAP-like repeat-containing protein [bacterium]|nr:FG-GAP-like repeat-containing protein [bacterium]